MKKKIRLFAISFFSLALLFTPVLSHSATNGDGLTISPPISDITISPGEKVTKTIRLSNPTDKLIEVYPKVLNFKAGGQTGEPSFYEETDNSSKYSLAKWVTFSDAKVALAPEQVVEYSYTINVPNDAEPGGHYGAVFFANQSDKNTESRSQVSLGSMIGSLVLVRVPGKTIESGSITSFLAAHKIYFDNNIKFDALIANMGNIHFSPKGQTVITDMGGQQVDTLKFNETGGNVLPDSSRKFSNSWNSNKFLLGAYTAKLNLSYGTEGKSLNASYSFWVIPLWVVAVAALVLLLLIAVIVYFIVKKKTDKPLPSAVRIQRHDINKGVDKGDGNPPVILR